MSFVLKKGSALGPEIEGSIGTFKVSNSEETSKTLEVKYFLTHVGLDFKSGSSSGILSQLAPVRELFEAGSLEFDEIMQRDLDDARVSSELIPYLLDPGTRDLVKLFPPIIVVILPTKGNENKPGDLYDAVYSPQDESTDQSYKIRKLISGKAGEEIFEFSQPVENDVLNNHNLARLRLNQQRTKLVIVDGQHRAMALLALYRNLKDEWTDQRRSPYESYYAEWSKEYIQQFKLDHLSMPVMLCTFPELDENFKGDYDLKKASRAIFLALNKNAKKVSESRNKLLDDNDLIALFLRNTLSLIKSKHIRSDYPLQIFNVELDQSHDKMKIDNPVAITGVNHVYYMIEHIVLNNFKDVNGIRPRTGKFFKRKNLEDANAMTRLDARNKLGSDEANETQRDSFSTSSGDILANQFKQRFGRIIVEVLDRFTPFKLHCDSTLAIELDLKANNKPNHSILFDGQGIFNVFNTHRENLKSKSKKNIFGSNPSQINAIIDRLDAQKKSLEQTIIDLSNHRAKLFIEKIYNKNELYNSDKSISPHVVRFIDNLYNNVFTTVAYQSALVITFISSIEQAFGLECWNSNELLVNDEFENYLDEISKLFSPRSVAELKNLAEVFVGHIEGSPFDWKITKTNHTFRAIVYSEEMQPDQWPKYKYLFLELWKPKNPQLAEFVSQELTRCRAQVLFAFIDKKKKEWLLENNKHEDAMTKPDHQHVIKISQDLYRILLNKLNHKDLTNNYFESLREDVDTDSNSIDTDDTEMWGDTE